MIIKIIKKKSSAPRGKRDKKASRLLLYTLCVLCLVGTPSTAFATKSLPDNVHILLGFKQAYGVNNKQHLGVDVYEKAGAEIFSPVDGVISFIGRVPGSAGLNVTALTVTTPEGYQVSINPFLNTEVSKGEVIKKGKMLGILSDVGDPSSPEVHYHLSLRVGGVYKDPTYLLHENISKGSTPYNANKKEETVMPPTVQNSSPTSPKVSTQQQATVPQRGTEQSKGSVKAKSALANKISTSSVSESNSQGERNLVNEGVSPNMSDLGIGQNNAGVAGKKEIEGEDLSKNEESNYSNRVFSSQGVVRAERVSENHHTYIGSRNEGVNAIRVEKNRVGLKAEAINQLSNLSQFQIMMIVTSSLAILALLGMGGGKFIQLVNEEFEITNTLKKKFENIDLTKEGGS